MWKNGLERGRKKGELKLRLIDADALKERFGESPYNWTDSPEEIQAELDWDITMNNIDEESTVDAIPIWWLNERHRKCCEEADTDLMDVITVLCNEYHVWQKRQENQND